MQRDTAVAVVLALLALLAIGAAGATLENPAAPESGSGFGDGGGGSLGAQDGGGNTSGNQSASNTSMQWTGAVSGACMEILQTLWAKLLLVGFVVAVSGYVWWRTGSQGFAVLTAALYGPIVYVVWFALASCQTIQEAMAPPQPPTNQTTQTPTANTSGGSFGASVETATNQPSILLGIVLVVVVLAALVLLYVASSDDVDAPTEADSVPETPEETDIAAVGRVAGEAADRIETGDEFGNEVYRAWAEMTTHLAVEHPESSTPAEFAAAAVDAGMDADDVGELTDLFEEVRYGDREVTEERERRATAALRRIEESYAEGEG